MAKPITIKITGDDSGLKKTLGSVESRLGAFGKMAGKAALVAGAAGAAAVAGIAVAGYKIGKTFDEMDDSIAIATGATGDRLTEWTDMARDISTQVPLDFQTIGDAVGLAATNITGSLSNVEDFTVNVAEASRLLGEDVVTNIDAASRAANAFGLEGEAVTGVGDLFFAASQKYGVGFTQIAGAVQTFGPVLRNAGFSIEETTALIGQFEQGGIDITRIMPGLNAATRKWAEEGLDAKDMLEQNVTAIANATSETEALALATEVFGAEGAQRMSTAIRTGAIDLENLSDSLEGAGGSVAETAAETDSFGEKFTKFKNKMMVALEPLATRIFDSLGAAFERAAPYIESFITNASRWIEQYGIPALQKLFEWGGKVVGYIQQHWPTIQRIAETVFAALQTAVSAAVGWIRDNWPTIQGIFESVGDVIGEVVTFIVGAVEWFREVFSNATEGTGEDGNSMIETLQSIWDMFVSAFEAIVVVFETAVAIISALWGVFGDTITEVVTTVVGYVIETLNNAAQILGGIFDLIKALLTGKWGEAWEAVKQILSGAWAQVQNLVRSGLSVLGSILGKVISLVTKPFRDAFNSVFSFLGSIPGKMGSVAGRIGSALVDGIKKAGGAMASIGPSLARGLLNAFKSAWNSVAGSINRFIPDSISIGAGPFSYTQSFPPNPVPTFASGGYMSRSGMAMVGERGPEAVYLPKGAQVKPNHSLGGSEGVTVNVTSQADPWEIGDAVAWNLKTVGV